MVGKTPSKKRARKKKTKPKKLKWKSIGFWVAVLALVAAVAVIGWRVGLRPEMRESPPAEEPTPKLALTSAAFQDSLEEELVRLGLSAKRIRKRSLTEGGHGWEWAVGLPPGQSLVRANARISAAVRRWGGWLGVAEESKSLRTGGTALRMELGNDSAGPGWLILEDSGKRAEPAKAEPRLAIVIDDMGYFFDPVVKAFIEFSYPITLGLLPGTPYAEAIYLRALAVGQDVILHLPMEPHGYPSEDPGPRAILIEMNGDEILRRFEENLAAFPEVEGFSNHMGSAATEDTPLMRVLLGEAARRCLFFLDSLTSSRSVGTRVAAEFGVPCVTNDLFVDNNPDDLESIKEMIRRVGRRAQTRGWAVGIGHPHGTTLEALREGLAELEADGIRMVPVSELVSVRIARR